MPRRALATLLFAAYFLLYAVSPLTFSVHAKGAGGRGLEPRSLHVLVWELIVEGLTARIGSHHKDGKSTILIIKKRALIPEDDALRLGQHTPVIHRASIASSALDSPAQNIPDTFYHTTHAGFHPLYSGHSPPLS